MLSSLPFLLLCRRLYLEEAHFIPSNYPKLPWNPLFCKALPSIFWAPSCPSPPDVSLYRDPLQLGHLCHPLWGWLDPQPHSSSCPTQWCGLPQEECNSPQCFIISTLTNTYKNVILLPSFLYSFWARSHFELWPWPCAPCFATESPTPESALSSGRRIENAPARRRRPAPASASHWAAQARETEEASLQKEESRQKQADFFPSKTRFPFSQTKLSRFFHLSSVASLPCYPSWNGLTRFEFSLFYAFLSLVWRLTTPDWLPHEISS